jgi:Starch-binding associating with outer membrane
MKSQIIKISASFITCAAILLTGCKKGNEYYVNPNSPTSATLQTLLTALEVSTMNSYEGDFARTSNILVQHGAGVDGQATQVHVYNLAENQFDNQWGQVYQAINTGNILIEKAGSANPRYKGLAKIFLAFNWGLLTDFWGDIPYSEAISGVKFPKYDSQEDVLNGIQTLLTEAITDLQSVPADNILVPAADDVIFGGNANAWIKTAWTLKARYLNRLSKKTNYNADEILAALSNGISSNSEDCMSKHGPAGIESNQWYAFQKQRPYIKAGKPLVDSMKSRPSDERLSKYFIPTAGNVTGSPINPVEVTSSTWGIYLFGDDPTTPLIDGNPANPLPLVTNFEALFIRAEALARKGEPIAAATALNNAIKASCLKVTRDAYNGESIATYLAGEANVGRIMYEKWIAMFGQCEAYHDYRRTGFPDLEPNPVGAIPDIPKRLPTPATERTANPNAPVPHIDIPVWWAN